MIGQKRIPSREGGIEVAVEELSVRMVRRGHQVTCLNRRTSREEKRNREYKGVRIRSVFTLRGRGIAAVSGSAAAAVTAAFGKYDIVHFHAEGPCAMIWIPKLFGKRCIASIHGLDWKRQKWSFLAGSFIKMGEKAAVRYADEIIVLSKGMKEYFRRAYGRDTVFIPNGVNRPQKLPAKEITEKFGLKKDGYILFLGRLVPEKGLRYLIEAFRRTNTDKRLVIAGGSSDTDSFIRKIKKLASDDQRILFTGFAKGTILNELYSNAYIYCLPSDLEGMPLSLLEGMSFGNCCLTSDIPECGDVVQDHAVLFQKGNIEDLREKLQFLCDHPETVQKYKTISGEFILKRYPWEQTVEKTLEVYRRL